MKEGSIPMDESGAHTAGLTLEDRASGQYQKILTHLSDQQRTAADLSAPAHERLTAYEDIIASEVGDTMLSRARSIERETGRRQLFVKFEGGNPSGTHKDRIAFAQVEDAIRRGYDTITFASCGNYGAALAFASSLAGIHCEVVIPTSYKTRREQEILKLGASIIREGSDYEEAVTFSSRRAAARDLYDANPGGANTTLQLKAYGQIADEIYDDLRDAPYAVAVPVSNGTALAGIYRGFLNLYRRGKTSRIPRLIAGSTSRKNPIVASWKKRLDHCTDLLPEKVRESPINEPLVNWHAIDGDHALQAIYESDGWAVDVSDKAMLSLSALLREQEGLSVLPASTAGLYALITIMERKDLPNDRYVAVLTGRK
jgi:threonine synthase